MTKPANQLTTLQEHQGALLTLLQEFDRICKALDIHYILFAGSMLGAVRHQGFIPWDDDLDVLMPRKDYDRFLEAAHTLLDADKFYLQKEFSERWPMFFTKLRLNGTTCLERYHPRDPQHHQGVYMDIFPCDNTLKSNFGRRLQFFCSKVVIAKSLNARGYDTNKKKKKLFMKLCNILPMKPFLAVTKMGREDSPLVHSFLGAAASFTKNVFPREYLQDTVEATFAGGIYPIPRENDALLRLLYDDYMRLPDPEERDVKLHAILVDLNNSYEKYRDYRDGMEFTVFTRSIR